MAATLGTIAQGAMAFLPYSAYVMGTLKHRTPAWSSAVRLSVTTAGV